jgi:hypothetical protein
MDLSRGQPLLPGHAVLRSLTKQSGTFLHLELSRQSGSWETRSEIMTYLGRVGALVLLLARGEPLTCSRNDNAPKVSLHGLTAL